MSEQDAEITQTPCVATAWFAPCANLELSLCFMRLQPRSHIFDKVHVMPHRVVTVFCFFLHVLQLNYESSRTSFTATPLQTPTAAEEHHVI